MNATEDWWSVWLGILFFVLGLFSIWHLDLVGWIVKPKTWEFSSLMRDFSWNQLFKSSGSNYKDMHPLFSVIITYLSLLVSTSLGAYFLKLNIRKYFFGFSIIFLIAFLSWIIGHEAHLSSVDSMVKGENLYEKFQLSWGLQLGEEIGYIIALLIGLIIGNFFKDFAEKLKEAAKPEWFIKTAIVLLGIKLGMMTLEAAGFTYELALSGAIAAFVAYLIFWPLVYLIGRRYFGLNRSTAAVLSSGISVCGVSASMATAGAIKAKPVIPMAISSLVLIFALVEMIILPPLYTKIAPNQPIVNGAAIGMTVKTDGADAAAGAVLDNLMVSYHLKKTGEKWEDGWILNTALLTKIWIDMFIGVWSFVLAVVWIKNNKNGTIKEKIPLSEIWYRFPKFVLGYVFIWILFVVLLRIPEISNRIYEAESLVQGLGKILFLLTFTGIGIITDFSKLKGMGKLTLLYAIALFAVIAPIAYFVAWIFHRGMTPLVA